MALEAHSSARIGGKRNCGGITANSGQEAGIATSDGRASFVTFGQVDERNANFVTDDAQ